MFMLGMSGLYCVLCFKVTKDAALKYRTDGIIGIHFYCDNYGFRKEGDDLLRYIEYLFNQMY